MRESTAHPDSETLAAFLDGRLSGDDRRRVVAHLDACGDCYEVFAETVRFQGEEEPRGRVVTSSRFGSRRWHWPAVAAAAALVMAVLVAVPVLRMDPERPVLATLPPGGEAGATAGALVAAIDPDDEEALASAIRRGWPGGELGFVPDRLSRDTVSFRAGVWLVNLRAAARTEDREAAGEVLDELAAIAEAAGVAAELKRPISTAAEAARDGRPGELEEATTEVEERATGLLDPASLALGKWAEAGRLAATVGAAEFFRAPTFHAILDDSQHADLAEATAEVLEQIRALAAEGVGPEEMEALQRLFRELIATY